MYNDGYECRVFRPVAGSLNFLGKSNVCMGNMILSHTYPHNPRPAKSIANITEKDLDSVLNGYTRDSKVGSMRGARDNWNKAKQKVIEHAKENKEANKRRGHAKGSDI